MLMLNSMPVQQETNVPSMTKSPAYSAVSPSVPLSKEACPVGGDMPSSWTRWMVWREMRIEEECRYIHTCDIHSGNDDPLPITFMHYFCSLSLSPSSSSSPPS